MRYQSLIFLVLIGSNLLIWNSVIFGASNSNLNLYFLDVGQGDGSLVRLPGGVDVLIDGGPGRATLNSLSRVLPQTDRYIDLAVITHAQLDHFGGFIDIFKNYAIGAVIWNGREGTAAAWPELAKLVEEKNIKTVVLKEGDKITYGDNVFDVLSPGPAFLKSKELNDTGLVLKLESKGAKTLFTADIGENIESYLIKKYDLDIDILKVAHHGSRFSSSEDFLFETTPLISSVSSGAKNRYGHPTKQALAAISVAHSSLYRTDEDGTVHVEVDDGKIRIYQSN